MGEDGARRRRTKNLRLRLKRKIYGTYGCIHRPQQNRSMSTTIFLRNILKIVMLGCCCWGRLMGMGSQQSVFATSALQVRFRIHDPTRHDQFHPPRCQTSAPTRITGLLLCCRTPWQRRSSGSARGCNRGSIANSDGTVCTTASNSERIYHG